MHFKTQEEVLRELNTSIFGLSEEEAKQSLLTILIRQYANPLIIILIIAGILAIFLGNWHDSVVVLGLVLINGIIGF